MYRSFMNTLFVIFLAMFVCVPISMYISFYLSEISKDSFAKRNTLNLVRSASSTPSIMFGIFGLSFFIETLGLTGTGKAGKSLLAGILTIIFLILPYLTNLFYKHVSEIPDHYRETAYTLGLSKFTTFKNIILPLAASNLIFSILMSIGKIVGETAPFYLTAGLSSIPQKTLLLYQGQTLTTRIYNTINMHSIDDHKQVMGETTFFCMLLLTVLIFSGVFVVP